MDSSLTPITPRRFNFSSLTHLVFLLLLIAIGFLVYINRYKIEDWWRLRGYSPPQSVVQLANEDTMTPYTKHLFYLNRPELLPTVSSFRQDCPESKDIIVLGCYHSGQNGIFIYNVQDSSLNGVQQVTAAHEVLHSVYARLSNKAKTTLDSELEDYYLHDLTDSTVKAEVKIYQQTEPGSVMDEMSCTFGTEIANLPPGLNAYYKQYFSNRAVIVGYEQQYQAEFTTRENEVNQYDAQLSTIKSQISSKTSQLNSQLGAINSEQPNLVSERSDDVEAYNAAVPVYNQLVDTYNSEATTAQNLINQYNQVVATRNQAAGALDSLDHALDTRLTTQPTTSP